MVRDVLEQNQLAWSTRIHDAGGKLTSFMSSRISKHILRALTGRRPSSGSLGSSGSVTILTMLSTSSHLRHDELTDEQTLALLETFTDEK